MSIHYILIVYIVIMYHILSFLFVYMNNSIYICGVR